MGSRRRRDMNTFAPTCDGKAIFANNKAAKCAAARARRRTGHPNIHIYRCPKASHLHIGHDKYWVDPDAVKETEPEEVDTLAEENSAKR